MSHGYVVCPTTGKRGWESRRLAVKTMRIAGNRVRAYRCECCHRWHVTHEAYEPTPRP
jgi:hypothetical protein